MGPTIRPKSSASTTQSNHSSTSNAQYRHLLASTILCNSRMQYLITTQVTCGDWEKNELQDWDIVCLVFNLSKMQQAHGRASPNPRRMIQEETRIHMRSIGAHLNVKSQRRASSKERRKIHDSVGWFSVSHIVPLIPILFNVLLVITIS